MIGYGSSAALVPSLHVLVMVPVLNLITSINFIMVCEDFIMFFIIRFHSIQSVIQRIVIGLKIRTNFPENYCRLPEKLTSSAFSEHISQIKLVHSNILVIIQL